MNDKKIDCLILTGMHQSGISPLVQCLTLMGVDFGQNRLNKNADDAVESTAIGDVTMVHDILLRDLGCRWDMVGALPEDWLDTKAAAHAKKRIVHLIEDQFQNNGLWAVADPRLCRLLPLWKPVLQEKGLNPGIILTIRHPWEVAQSLNKNSGMDFKQSHLLWLAMNKEVFDFCQQYAYIVNTFDQMLADPAAILRDIGEQFGLTFSNPLQQQIHHILDVVRPEFKHHNRRGGTQSDSNGKSYSSFGFMIKLTVTGLPQNYWLRNLPRMPMSTGLLKMQCRQGYTRIHFPVSMKTWL